MGARTLARIGMMNRLTEAQFDEVRACCSRIDDIPPRTTISRAREPLDHSLLLLDGMVTRYMTSPAARQMVAIEVPGDFVDLHGLPLGELDHDVVSLNACSLAVFPHERLRALVDARTETGLALWALTLIDAAVHRHWSFRLGAFRALARAANFVAELHMRLSKAGLAEDGTVAWPLTQADMGEACGMSPVHVNRVMRELREAGVCAVRDGRLTILSQPELHRLGQFDADALFLSY